MLKKGEQIPDDIELKDHDGNVRKLSEFKGNRTIYYVYPKNFTPGCVTEAKKFRNAIKDYKNADIRIIGISADSPESHKKFKAKYNLPFTLLSDPKKIFMKELGSLQNGRIKRRTWLVDENGIVEKVYKDVSPSKHNNELCEYYSLKKGLK
jgi:peroxiredoxin Q/BCP